MRWRAFAAVAACVVLSPATARADADDARADYAGTWHGSGTFYATVYSKPGPSSDTTSCAWEADKTYLVCSQDSVTPYGPGKQLTVYARIGDAYVFQRIDPSGAVHTAEVTVSGKTWTYSNATYELGKRVVYRTINVFDGNTQRWYSEFSYDGKRWTRMAEGVETRTATP
ncbi:MAG: hypothetical protein JO175_00640 [Candidatus Eremiobacteraeota bacterium]|nr:hypothetical protein [Candidatus Eremiobacteraeota bacterium]